MNRNDRKIVLTALAVAVVALFAAVLLDGSDPHQAHRAHETHEPHKPHEPYETHKPYKPNKPQNPHSAPLPQPTSHEVFPFDPNTADSTQLARLGLQHWQIRNIYRYRAKGGVYRKKEDFARLYGLTVKDYRRLEPYIRISSDYQPAATLVAHKAHEAHEPHEPHNPYPQKIDSTQHIVLNTADTTELKRVPGIGSYYAKEIVRYGRWLGGYVSVEQLDEIDQFPTSAKKYFVVTNPSPQRLNINSLSLQQLRRHPYINYFMAKTIVEHRRLHGRIKNLQELSGYRDFTPQIIRRLEPYIAY